MICHNALASGSIIVRLHRIAPTPNHLIIYTPARTVQHFRRPESIAMKSMKNVNSNRNVTRRVCCTRFKLKKSENYEQLDFFFFSFQCNDDSNGVKQKRTVAG